MQTLTSQQQRAISKTEGPCVVLAGAGTGKTYTIVEKIRYLIEKKIYSPERIVCITFSNEAANSLQNRISKILPENSEKPIIKTFHAFSADLLREHGNRININKNFRILTPDEAKIIIHKNLRVTVMNCHKYISSIGIAKDLEISLEELKENIEKKSQKYQNIDLEKRLESLMFELQTLHLKKDKDKHELSEEIRKIKEITNIKKFVSVWQAYEKIKEKNNFQDYSDLNKKSLEMIKKNVELATNYSYIIIDEFQDTNKIQLDFLFCLAPHKNIMVVGDTNQSIYRFRGAYHRNLDDFKKHFNIRNEDVLNLDESYRSTNKILRCAHRLILKNYENKKECFEVKSKHEKEGENIKIFQLKNAKEESRKVLEIIQQKIRQGIPEKEICVMFRNHQYGRIIRKILEKENIRYHAASKSSLLEQKSIRVLIDYLSVLNKLKLKEKGGEQHWWNLLYELKFVEEDLIKIGKFIKDNKTSDSISVKILNELQNISLTKSGRAQAEVFVERIKLMIPLLQKKIKELIVGVFHSSGLIISLESKEEKEILLNFNTFLELAESHVPLYEPDLQSFIHHLEILKSLEIEIEAPKTESDGVQLMTLHSTKGLEYDTVIITNLAQKRFPSERSSSNPLLPLELYPEFRNVAEKDVEYVLHELEKKQQLSEERRLCYVAFTRAKNSLFLTFSENYNNKKHFPSQFLNEIKFKENKDVEFTVDLEEKYFEPLVEIKPAEIKKEIAKEFVFSPSSLLLFSECQKKFEYRYIYNMPEEQPENWEAIRLGSFVHLVLEEGVKNNFKSLKEYLDFSAELNSKEDWQTVELEEANHLIKVFFERNKNKYDNKSRIEQKLQLEIEGLKFIGYADRIDFSEEGLEIIDYKTGSSAVPPKNRNWQLGFYALASEKLGKVHKITLDMLKQDRPLEFKVDEKGNASALFSPRMEFNIHEVKEELLAEAKKVVESLKFGFKSCPIEKNCEFCNEHFYNN